MTGPVTRGVHRTVPPSLALDVDAPLLIGHRRNAAQAPVSLPASALLRHALVRPSLDNFPCQIVVIGPTQAGKSSIVNVLLNQEAAVASPLAGYTRHARRVDACQG